MSFFKKHKSVIVLFLALYAVNGLYAAKREKPDWVDNWRKLYPDNLYIAQLGQSTASAEAAKNDAVNRIAEYLKANVSSTSSTSAVNTTTVENDKVKTTSVKENAKQITVSVDISLSALEYTEAWYEKKAKTHYVLAYVSREKAWNAYKPIVEDAKKEFYGLYNKAVNEKEPLLSCVYYQSAKKNSEGFISALDFAHLINSAVDSLYAEDRKIISEIPAVVKKIILSCSLCINIEGDQNSIVQSAVLNSFSDLGFLVQESGARYNVQVVLDANVEKQAYGSRELYMVKPGITLSVYGLSSLAVYTFTYTARSVSKNFSLEKAMSAALSSFAKEIQTELTNDFREKMGLDSFIFLF